MIYHVKSTLLDNVSETVSVSSISIWCVEVQLEITSFITYPNDNGDSIQNVRYLLHFLLVCYLKKLHSIHSPLNLKILFNAYLWLIYNM